MHVERKCLKIHNIYRKGVFSLTRKAIAIVGGDRRLCHILQVLPQRSFCKTANGLYLDNTTKSIADVLTKSEIIIFGLPMLNLHGGISTPLCNAQVDLHEIFSHIRTDAAVFGGNIPQQVFTLADQMGFKVFDYITREEFAVSNAILTAEGVIELVLRQSEKSLYGTKCMVLGYGRIGKALTRLLLAFGANVAVYARKPSDLEWISLTGAKSVKSSEINDVISECEIIFNTVPAMLLDEQRLLQLLPECMVIDLASAPGGVDFAAAKRLGISAEQALSLPGKLLPVSAGEIILDTIENILTERGLIYG